jgi:tRNA pseudouridine55 synthase
MTSHDVVDRLRDTFGWRKVGHAGTLDPLATGVLVMLIGKATKSQQRFLTDDKAYRFRMRLGLETTTHDIEGEVVREHDGPVAVTREELERALEGFRGEVEQIPPMVSAIKHKGKPLYKYARKGVDVKREPRRITISAIALLSFDGHEAEVELTCSKGTYVRTIAHDLGRVLGTGACLTELRRTRSGCFAEEGLHALDSVCELTPNEVFYLLKTVSEVEAAEFGEGV